MARIARVVVPGAPHHVTQRGNRGEPVFFRDADYRLYRRLVAAAAARARSAVLAYCLLPSEVHLIVVPSDTDGLRATLADAHRRYAAEINMRFGWTGHLFQGRFGAVALDAPHLAVAARHVALAPVAAGLAGRPEDWPWSSARSHLAGADDTLAPAAPLRDLIPDLARLLAADEDTAATDRLRRAATIGRPLGAPSWIAALETRLGRRIAPRRPGRKPNAAHPMPPLGVMPEWE